jgi:hypothetical protein
MASDSSHSISIFWSWQSDSPAKQNRNFIEDCLRKAVKNIGQENTIINVDRDTQGIGGTPEIANAILSKIRASDIFVWDATLVCSQPQPSPNANVLIEFGYALAIMGDGRIIGIMNAENGLGGDRLPFDLNHRRWPISYSLRAPRKDAEQVEIDKFKIIRKEIGKELVEILSKAILDAVKEQKVGAFHSDTDYHIARELWGVIDSKWITYWSQDRDNNPQFETKENYETISRYLYMNKRPEFKFENNSLNTVHALFVRSLDSYLSVIFTEMIPDGPSSYIISVKRSGFVKDYDKIYDRQVDAIRVSLKVVMESWAAYVKELRSRYPEIVIRE